MASHSIVDPPAYVLDQVFGFQSVNNLFDNDAAIVASIEEEHDFATGVHTTPRVAQIEGLILYSAGYAIARGTNISSVDVSGLSAGQCRVNFAVTFASQDFAIIPAPEYSAGGESAGWEWDGASVASVIINLVNSAEVATDMTFSLVGFGVIA